VRPAVFRGAAVAALVVLAGCSGFAGAPSGGSPTDTLTPVPVPEADRQTRAPAARPTGTADRRLVPGVTTERLVDPFALVDAHIVGITAASYRARQTTTVRYPNGTLRTREVTTAQVGSGAERYQLSNEVTGPSAASVRTPPGRFEIWTDGDRFLSRFRPHGGAPEYARIAPDRYLAQREYYSPPPNRGELLALFSAFEVRPVERRPRLSTPTVAPGTRASRGGTATASGTPRPVPVRGNRSTPSVDGTLVGYRLVGTAFTGPSALETVGPGTEPRNASLAVLVDTRGRIRRYDLRYTAVVAGERMRVTQQGRYEVGRVRVGRPDWYGAALRATNATTTPPSLGERTATATSRLVLPTD
jgi:hypothetical protein